MIKIDCLKGKHETYISKFVMLKSNLDDIGGFVMERSEVKSFDEQYQKKYGHVFIGDGISQYYVADLSEIYDKIVIMKNDGVKLPKSINKHIISLNNPKFTKNKMERCNIVTKSGSRCLRLTSLVEKTHLHLRRVFSNRQMYSKKSTKGRTFKLGEVWELKNENKWVPVCKLHFNRYLNEKTPPLK